MFRLFIAVTLLASALLGPAPAAEDPADAEFNQKLAKSAQQVISDYKLFRRYSDAKFTPEARLAEINDRVSDEDVTQDEMVSLRRESWALNEADFNVTATRAAYFQKLRASIKAYKDAREESKIDPNMKLSKENEVLLIKAEQVCQNPDSLTLDVTLPGDKARKPKPKDDAAPKAAVATGTSTGTNVATKTAPPTPSPAPAQTAPTPAPAPTKALDPKIKESVAKFGTIIYGKVRGVLIRTSAEPADPNKWTVAVDVKEVLKGPAIPGNEVSVYITAPTAAFGLYKSIDELKGRACVWALNLKEGVVTESLAPFAMQKFETDDLDALRDAVKEPAEKK